MGDRGGTKLFVYGVSSSCPKSVIQREFDKFGKVDDVFITGKGYAFVTMEDEDEARDAVKELNGSTVDGQEIKVEISHGRGKSGGGRSGGGGGGRRFDRDRRDRSRDRRYSGGDRRERDRSGRDR